MIACTQREENPGVRKREEEAELISEGAGRVVGVAVECAGEERSEGAWVEVGGKFDATPESNSSSAWGGRRREESVFVRAAIFWPTSAP